MVNPSRKGDEEDDEGPKDSCLRLPCALDPLFGCKNRFKENEENYGFVIMSKSEPLLRASTALVIPSIE